MGNVNRVGGGYGNSGSHQPRATENALLLARLNRIMKQGGRRNRNRRQADLAEWIVSRGIPRFSGGGSVDKNDSSIMDDAVTSVKGLVHLGDLAVDRMDSVTGGEFRPALKRIGYDSDESQSILNSYYSPSIQKVIKEEGEAEGMRRYRELRTDSIKETATDMVAGLMDATLELPVWIENNADLLSDDNFSGMQQDNVLRFAPNEARQIAGGMKSPGFQQLEREISQAKDGETLINAIKKNPGKLLPYAFQETTRAIPQAAAATYGRGASFVAAALKGASDLYGNIKEQFNDNEVQNKKDGQNRKTRLNLLDRMGVLSGGVLNGAISNYFDKVPVLGNAVSGALNQSVENQLTDQPVFQDVSEKKFLMDMMRGTGGESITRMLTRQKKQ